MPALGTVTVIGLVAAVILIWFYLKLRRQDMLGALVEKRRASSKLVSRAEYVEGVEHMPVALALTDDTFYYENQDLQASFELQRIDQIEYDDELATGTTVAHGQRVLRLRSHGVTFEFILSPADAQKWQAVLSPARGEHARAV